MPVQSIQQQRPAVRPNRAPAYHCSVCDEVWDIRFTDNVHRYCGVMHPDGTRETGRPVKD